MKYKKRRHWRYTLFEDEIYATGIVPDQAIRLYVGNSMLEMNMAGFLTIHENYVWDGASGPAINTKNSRTPSLVHDALYNLFREQLLDAKKWRKRADKILYEMLIARGMSKFRAKLWYKAVRKGAAHAADYDVLTAP